MVNEIEFKKIWFLTYPVLYVFDVEGRLIGPFLRKTVGLLYTGESLTTWVNIILRNHILTRCCIDYKLKGKVLLLTLWSQVCSVYSLSCYTWKCYSFSLYYHISTFAEFLELPSNRSDHARCIVCTSEAPLLCSVCKTRYCSQQCQNNDWPQHRLNCLPPP